jgi:transcriptional regulator with XRE-family HTH domain
MSRNDIGERLKTLRGDKTQKEVADALDLTVGAISQYENGLRIPSDAIKMRIARYYGVSVQEIFFEP